MNNPIISLYVCRTRATVGVCLARVAPNVYEDPYLIIV